MDYAKLDNIGPSVANSLVLLAGGKAKVSTFSSSSSYHHLPAPLYDATAATLQLLIRLFSYSHGPSTLSTVPFVSTSQLGPRPPPSVRHIFYATALDRPNLAPALIHSCLSTFCSPPVPPPTSGSRLYLDRLLRLRSSFPNTSQPVGSGRFFLNAAASNDASKERGASIVRGGVDQSNAIVSFATALMDISLGVVGASASLLTLPLRLFSAILSPSSSPLAQLKALPSPPSGCVYISDSVVSDLYVSLLLLLLNNVRGPSSPPNPYWSCLKTLEDDRPARGEEGEVTDGFFVDTSGRHEVEEGSSLTTPTLRVSYATLFKVRV